MHDDTATMHKYFARLGFEPDIASLYLALHEHGPQTLLQLSRASGVERTRIYRLLDSLRASHLIEETELYKRKEYRAAPLSNLQILLTQREDELQGLRTEMHRLDAQLEQTRGHASGGTHVQTYHGADGLKQMLWNQTRSDGENVGILYENMQGRTKRTFFERWAQTCNERGITFRSIVGPHFLQTQADWYAAHTNIRLEHWSGRLAHEDLFPITQSMIVYGDVVAYFDWKADDLYGIEIYNASVAHTQRQLFELLWQQASPLTTGESVV